MKKRFALLLSVGLLLVSAGCGLVRKEKLVNEQAIRLAEIDAIEIRYGEGHVAFFAGDGDTLVIREFMDTYSRGYEATCSSAGGRLTITNGKRPRDPTFDARIEVYVPLSYTAELSAETKGGTITLEMPHTLAALCLESTSGQVSCADISADTIRLTNRSGSIDGKNVSGTILLHTDSGSTRLSRLTGSGTFTGGSGRMELDFAALTGELSVAAGSGRMELSLPKRTDAYFQAHTGSGSLQVELEGDLQKEEHQVTGILGTHPACSISLSTTSGRIQVTHS